MKFLVPQGIGDALWALTKIVSVADAHGAGDIDVAIACFEPDSGPESRALEFVKRFDCVRGAEMYRVPRQEGLCGPVLLVGPPTDEKGRFHYLPDGPPPKDRTLPGIDYVLMPNAPLERGERLETWLPEYETDFAVMDWFVTHALDREIAFAVQRWAYEARQEKYAVFFLGSAAANASVGHNRGGLWTVADWVDLITRTTGAGVRVLLIGAPSDADYAKTVYDGVIESWTRGGDHVWNIVGLTTIGQTVEVLRRAAFVVAYQSGLGVVSSYLGVPTGMFWRPEGDSITTDFYSSFDERMAHAWAPPAAVASGRHVPLVYTKCTPSSILQAFEAQGCL